MPNYNVINTEQDPLYVAQINTFRAPGIDTSQEWQAAVNGILFGATASGSPTSAQNLLLQISNPAASGKTLYLSRITGSISIAGATLTILRGGTFSGITVTPSNFNFGSANVSVMNVQRLAGTVAGSPVTLISAILAAGQFSGDYNGRIIVPPGNVLTTSIGLGAATASLNLGWWEY